MAILPSPSAVYTGAHFSVTYDARGVQRFQNAVAALGDNRLVRAEVRALNHIGNKAFTEVKRALVKQTGIQYGKVDRAVSRRLAFAGVAGVGDGAVGRTLEYSLEGKGGELSLKYFRPRETKSGVSAAPWNERKVFPGTFLKGGRFPDRVAISSMGGHVFSRTGAGRLPVERKWGPAIGKEIVKDQALAAFQSKASEFPARLEHEVRRLLP